MLKIRVLGRNGLYPTKDSATSGYLVKTDKVNVLFDCGAGVFASLLSCCPPEELDAIIISHLHYDHCSDLGVLSYYLQTRKRKLKIYFPFDEGAISNSLISNEYYECYNLNYTKNIELIDLYVDFLLMKHPVTCYSASFYSNGKKLSLTADTNACENVEVLIKNADLVIADSAFLAKEWNENKPHLSAELCARYMSKFGRGKLLLSHINPMVDKALLLSEARAEYQDCEIADLIEYEV